MLGLKEYLSSREQEIRQVFARRAPAASQFPVRSLRRRIRSARPRGRLTAGQMARLIERRATVPTNLQRYSRKAKRRMMSYWEEKGVLATHRWHAKRFEMADGIPLRVRDKGERAIYRIASHRCVVLDRSFWPCVEVECSTSEALDSGLEEGLRTSPSLTKGVFASDNALRAAALLYSTEGEVVSPIYLLREGKSARKALIWIHPSGAEHLNSQLSGRVSSMVELRPTDLSWFALYGPRARQVLTKALGIAPPSSLGEVVHSGGVRLVTTTQGCDVVASEKIKEVFRKLVFAGASAIGQEDWEKLHRGVPCFPADYPDSPACRRRSAERAKAAIERQSKRPGTLRGESLAIESPLFADWSLLADLEGLALPRVEGRGSGVESEVALYQPKEDGESVRRLIGFVTSGGYGYRQGCGVAIAFMQASWWSDSLPMKKVWFRNVTSRHYHGALVEKVGRWESADSFLSGVKAVSTYLAVLCSVKENTIFNNNVGEGIRGILYARERVLAVWVEILAGLENQTGVRSLIIDELADIHVPTSEGLGSSCGAVMVVEPADD
ncbi:Ribonucleases P/MRP protein subunit pop1, variant 2 [Perkinsus olseni]|nr:Ribonucleases P/MRP protein subunit pop1, variant 2 [Perkinsus olseni]